VSRAPSSGRLSLGVLLVVLLAAALAFVVPRLTQPSTSGSGQQNGGSVPPTTYPKMGHAPDYTWVAGQVAFTRIQGGCVYIQADNNERFIPGGTGWDPSKVKHNDYVVIFGHIAGPDEPHEMCPGGRQYVIDRMQLNP
jgi:hypothetical protein